MILGVDHLNVVVADLARSVRFYTEVLGFRRTADVTMEGEWIEAIVGLRGVRGLVTFVEPPGGGPRIELLQYVAPVGETLPANSRANTLGLRHLAFRVRDIGAMAARLRAAWPGPRSPPERLLARARAAGSPDESANTTRLPRRRGRATAPPRPAKGNAADWASRSPGWKTAHPARGPHCAGYRRAALPNRSASD